jgi:hypothetical protein
MKRLLETIPLQPGSHPSREDGMCAMEMVAWLAGEAHSDEPACACPVLAALVRASNDAMTGQERDQLLRPLVPMLVNSRRTAAVEAARGWRIVDLLVRTLAPRLLEQQGTPADARVLASLPPVGDAITAQAARLALTTCAAPLRPVAWVLDRAIDGQRAQRFVAAAAQVAGAIRGEHGWVEVAALVRRALTVPAPEVARAAQR